MRGIGTCFDRTGDRGIEAEEPPTRRPTVEVVVAVAAFETRAVLDPVVVVETFCVPVLILDADGVEGVGLICVLVFAFPAGDRRPSRLSPLAALLESMVE